LEKYVSSYVIRNRIPLQTGEDWPLEKDDELALDKFKHSLLAYFENKFPKDPKSKDKAYRETLNHVLNLGDELLQNGLLRNPATTREKLAHVKELLQKTKNPEALKRIYELNLGILYNIMIGKHSYKMSPEFAQIDDIITDAFSRHKLQDHLKQTADDPKLKGCLNEILPRDYFISSESNDINRSFVLTKLEEKLKLLSLRLTKSRNNPYTIPAEILAQRENATDVRSVKAKISSVISQCIKGPYGNDVAKLGARIFGEKEYQGFLHNKNVGKLPRVNQSFPYRSNVVE